MSYYILPKTNNDLYISLKFNNDNISKIQDHGGALRNNVILLDQLVFLNAHLILKNNFILLER
jgi:hypothetical protein